MAITFFKTCVKTFICAAFVVLAASTASFAGDWSGKYETTGTKGDPFTISLTDDGKATGNMKGAAISGTWTTNDANAAEIGWESGWTTTLSKDGNAIKKSAYSPDADKSAAPTHTTMAKKVQ